MEKKTYTADSRENRLMTESAIIGELTVQNEILKKVQGLLGN